MCLGPTSHLLSPCRRRRAGVPSLLPRKSHSSRNTGCPSLESAFSSSASSHRMTDRSRQLLLGQGGDSCSIGI